MPHKGRSWQQCRIWLNMQTESEKEGKQHTAWQMTEMSCGLQTIGVRASRLCGTVVMLQRNVMTKQHLDYLAGFRGKTQASLWPSAHRFVLICFCDRCKSVEMLSQPQWWPSSLIGVIHRWPCNRDVIKLQSWPTRKLAQLNVCWSRSNFIALVG